MAFRKESAVVPVVLITLGAVVSALFWLPGELPDRQRAIERTMVAGGLTLLALASWFALFSPFAGKTRAWGTIGFVAVVVCLAAAVRVEGTSGDLVPKLRWSWAPPRDAAIGDVAVESVRVSDPGVAFLQFLGPTRSAWVDVRLSRDWAARPPKLLWKREVGAAWSGFAVARGRAFTQEQRGPQELVVAYELLTGRPLWKHADEARFDTVLGGVGPRGTPSVDGERVYALGATGILNCLELETGRRVWSVDVAREANAPLPEYGFAGSPLVDGPRVLVQAGGRDGASLVAYDKATGKRVWAAGSETPAYASPGAAAIGGRWQILALNWQSCTGHDPDTGAQLWRYEWRGDMPKAAQPLPFGGDRLAISGGYALGTDAFRVSESAGAWKTEPLWASKHLSAKFSNVAAREGHLYGLSDGVLTCVNAETGQRTWRGTAYGHGQLLLAGDLLVVGAEDGRVALVEASPSAFRELGSLPVLAGKAWNHPALAGPYLLVRSDVEAACLELPR
jgi:outer membrane protein assembly factor BamB